MVSLDKQKMTIAARTLPPEEVTVPLGKVQVFRVEVAVDVAGTKITTTYFFVQGLGPSSRSLTWVASRSPWNWRSTKSASESPRPCLSPFRRRFVSGLGGV